MQRVALFLPLAFAACAAVAPVSTPPSVVPSSSSLVARFTLVPSSPDAVSSIPSTPIPVSSAPAQITGTVRGSLSFPGEGIPPTLRVCAVPAIGGAEVCTNEQMKDTAFTYGIGYELQLPPGRYTVYAAEPDMIPRTSAFYTQAVKCGLSVECVDHSPIEVEVRAGETTKGVDPGDWYVR